MPTEMQDFMQAHAIAFEMFFGSKNTRVNDDVDIALEGLADMDETEHLGRKEPKRKPISKLLDSGKHDKLSHAERLDKAVAPALKRLEHWLAHRKPTDSPSYVSTARHCVRVLRAADF
jgi:hypothetical protein